MNKENLKLVPEFRFPEFKKNGNWNYVNGNELFKPISNKNHNSDLPILAITQNQGAIPRELIDYNVSVSKKSIKGYKVIEIGDFIISLRSFQGGIEYSNYLGLCSPAYIILKNTQDIVNDFYRHYFKSFMFIQALNKNLEGLRDGKMISYKQFSEILIPNPKKSEQQKIANCLSSLDNLITVETEKLDHLKDHKKGLLQQLFPAKGETKPHFRFPEFLNDGDWAIKSLSSITKNLSNKRVPITSNVREKGEIPYYGATGVIDYVKDYIFNENLLLISEDGANLIDRNYPIAFSISSKTWVNNHAHVLKPINKHTQILVEKYINSISIEDYLTGLAQPKLNKENLNKIPIPLPENPKEQEKLADCFSSIDNLVEAQKTKIKNLKNHKKGLMQQLFPKNI